MRDVGVGRLRGRAGDGFGLRLPPGYGRREERPVLDSLARVLRDALEK